MSAQGAGNAIIYARRYALSALLNINSEEDHDGNEVIRGITKKQIKYIHVLAKEKGIDKDTLKNYSISMFGKDSSKDLTKDEASKMIEDIQNS